MPRQQEIDVSARHIVSRAAHQAGLVGCQKHEHLCEADRLQPPSLRYRIVRLHPLSPPKRLRFPTYAFDLIELDGATGEATLRRRRVATARARG
jgi:hypothetical protein